MAAERYLCLQAPPAVGWFLFGEWAIGSGLLALKIFRKARSLN